MNKKVFVSGCYDMLHSGHVAFFEEAAGYGDLYVGLGSDQTIFELKGRKTINSNAERLYMVKAIRFVKDAWINSGSGIMDFEKEVLELKPDIFFVNSDGFTPAKERFCAENNIKLIVSKRIPSAGLPARSTTALRQECRIPYRIELCGGWLDQPTVNKLHPGPVVTISIEPEFEFNDRSGMATSSRKKAVELWQTEIPVGDREKLAHTLFCVENPPGTEHISGAQDQLGMLLPGVNRLFFDNGFWPCAIDSTVDDEILKFIEDHLWLIQLPQRRTGYDVYKRTDIRLEYVRELAEATDSVWSALLSKDLDGWSAGTKRSFEAQIRMFPDMITPETSAAIEKYRSIASGWKLTGAGGGGYLLLISENEIPNAIQIHIKRS